jgi:hypothetical protein
MVIEGTRAKKARAYHADALEHTRHMNHFTAARITIWCAKKHTLEQSLVFEVRVQVELSHRQLAWSMTMLPGQIAPIQLLDISQQVVLIAGKTNC